MKKNLRPVQIWGLLEGKDDITLSVRFKFVDEDYT